MTEKTSGQVLTMKVADIKPAYRTTSQGKNIHLISFTDTDGSAYAAEELGGDGPSRFVVGVLNTFTVTTPGRKGSFDWIRFASAEGQSKPTTTTAPFPASRDSFIIAQNALNNATLLAVERGWTPAEIIEQATFFAMNVKLLASKLEN